MKTIKQISAGLMLCGALCATDASYAEFLSSLDYTPAQIASRCKALSPQAAVDKCMACFFLKNAETTFRNNHEIQFDTDVSMRQCYEIDESGTTWLSVFKEADCGEYNTEEIMNQCVYCMTGSYSGDKVIEPVDEGLGEIIFMVDDMEENMICDAPSDEMIKCVSGYYGHASFYYSEQSWEGCYKCPGTDATTQTINGGRTEITDCYIPKNKTVSDSSGKYIYTNDCYYTK